MAELCDNYLQRHAYPKKRPASVEGDKLLIRRYIRPKLGNRKVAAIGQRDLDDVHQARTN